MIDSGVRKVVFVALGKGKFQPRDVIIGAEGNDGEFQVLEGLKEDEEIVLSAQFMLDSESRLREAVQKMLEIRKRSSKTDPAETVKDMPDSGGNAMEMEMDALDMSDMTMD